MVKLFFLVVLAGLGWMGYQRYTKDAFILTDSKVENVEKLRTLAARLNRDLPKELDAETTLLRVDASSQGFVNRYKTTVSNAATLYNGDRLSPALPGLRRDVCSNRNYKAAMAKGFSVSYSYVDGTNSPVGMFTFRNADCIGV